SMWRCDTSQKVLEARVRAESVDPQVRFDEIGNVGRSFLGGFFEKLESLVVLTQARVDDPDHVGRNVGQFRLPLQFAKYLLGIGLPASGGTGVRKSRRGIRVAL